MILTPERAHVYLDRHIIPGQTVESEAELLRKVIEQSKMPGRSVGVCKWWNNLVAMNEIQSYIKKVKQNLT